MKFLLLRILVFVSLLVLVGCVPIEDYDYSLIALEEDTVEIYIIFERTIEKYDESIKIELFENIAKLHTKEQMPVTMMRETDKMKKKYKIIEFPTILIADNEQVLLQTTDINDAKELLSNRAKINPKN